MSASSEERKEEIFDDQIKTIQQNFSVKTDPGEVARKVNQILSTSDQENLQIEISVGKLSDDGLTGSSGLIYSSMGNFLKALANKRVTELKISTEKD